MQPAAERFWTTLERHSGIALGEGPRQLSYAELRHEVAARASQLQQLGVQRVALALDNGLEWALWDLALLRAGLICVLFPGAAGACAEPRRHRLPDRRQQPDQRALRLPAG
jgi:long-chain acyl-CoA synthetase